MSNKSIRSICISYETEQLIDTLFAPGQFSQWVEQKVKEEAAARLKLGQDPLVQSELSDMQERAVQILVKNWGDNRTLLLAQRWSGMIKERGGSVSADKLIELARKRKD